MFKQIRNTSYSISNDGYVYSNKTNKILKATLGQYAKVSIDGITTTVHRLVAEAFIANPEGKPHINHIDGDRYNNSVSNLEWCTNAENKLHAAIHGLVARGSAVNTSVMSEDDAILALEMLSANESSAEVARFFGVTRATISKLKLGQTWKHLDRITTDVNSTPYAKKLRAGDIPNIRAMLSEGRADRYVAELYGVAPATINQIRHGKTWTNF